MTKFITKKKITFACAPFGEGFWITFSWNGKGACDKVEFRTI
jgi:hypothetical protein